MTTALLATTTAFAGCSDDDPAQTRFTVTVRRAVGTFDTLVFNTPDGASAPGPLTAIDHTYGVTFRAAPGTRVSFATMQANSNDWFWAPLATGIALFDQDGNPNTGDVTQNVHLWDAGVWTCSRVGAAVRAGYP